MRDIERSVDGLLEVAGKVGANTAFIPQLEATAPVLGLIVEEAVVQDGYMNALTDGYGAHEHARVLSVAARRRRVAVLAVALIEVRRGLHTHLRPGWPRWPAPWSPSSPSTCARSSPP